MVENARRFVGPTIGSECVDPVPPFGGRTYDERMTDGSFCVSIKMAISRQGAFLVMTLLLLPATCVGAPGRVVLRSGARTPARLADCWRCARTSSLAIEFGPVLDLLP
jgi:hypothetical protein